MYCWGFTAGEGQVVEKLGVATDAGVGIETLADRVRDEVLAGGGAVVTPPLVGA